MPITAYANARHEMVTAVTSPSLFCTSPMMCEAATAAGPTTLTVFLGLISLAAALSFARPEGSLAMVLTAAGAAGLAAANHPSFSLLIVMVVLVAVLASRERPFGFPCVLCVLGVFLLTASLPLISALARQESLRDFLSHALYTAYPMFNPVLPGTAFHEALLQQLGWPLLLAAAIAVVFMFHAPTRHPALMMVGFYLMMGPLLISLTNPRLSTAELHDQAAPWLFAVGIACVFAAWGLAAAVGLLFRARRHALLAAAALTVAGVGVVHYESLGAPKRDHGFGVEMVHALLSECPQDAVLVSAEPHVASLVMAAQHGYGVRPDVAVIVYPGLSEPLQRERMSFAYPWIRGLDTPFPTLAVLDQWEHDHPVLFGKWIEHNANASDAQTMTAELALWSLIRANHEQRPLCFAGVSIPWLLARANPSALLLHYPGPAPVESIPREETVRRAMIAAARPDPGVKETLSALLVALSGNARQRESIGEAIQLAIAANLVNPNDGRPFLAMARAKAREGRSEDAFNYLDSYLWLTDGKDGDVVSSIEKQFECHRLAGEFRELVDQQVVESSLSDDLREKADALWARDELTVLVRGFARLSNAFPHDPEVLYEYAAVLAQLGDLTGSRDALAQAARITPSQVGAHLQEDGRFSLLERSHETS